MHGYLLTSSFCSTRIDEVEWDAMEGARQALAHLAEVAGFEVHDGDAVPVGDGSVHQPAEGGGLAAPDAPWRKTWPAYSSGSRRSTWRCVSPSCAKGMLTYAG
jgi:hypothetical protein